MRTRSVLALLLLLSSCTDSRTVVNRDAGPGSGDADTHPPPPPGGLTLAIEGAAWYTAGSLIVRARVGNGAGADPAPLAPSSFVLGLSGGAELSASFDSSPLSNPCRAELAVAAGGSVACELIFNSVSGTPERLHFRPPERMASASITACSSAAPGGLCASGQICQTGACAAQCGPSAPRGACASSDDVCVDGLCEARCSPSRPSGACEVGLCRDGVCDTSCRTVDTLPEGCIECLIPIYNGETECGLASEPCYDCAQCPAFGEQSDCQCLETAECFGCEAEAQALWDCAARLCPMCIR